MLIMFRAKNYCSFKDDVIIDMRATGLKEHLSHVSECCGQKTLRILAIYGANASGKSNLISAVFAYKNFILNQMYNMGQDSEKDLDIKDSSLFNVEPFLLSDNLNKHIEFEMIFESNETIYQYGVTFDSKHILSEWLLINNDLAFDRENQSLEYGKKFKKQLSSYSKFPNDRLYLSVLDYFVTDDFKNHIVNIKSFLKEKLNVYFELFIDFSIKGTGLSIGIDKKMIEDENFRNTISDYVRKIDVGILDLVVDSATIFNKSSGEQDERKIIKTLHAIYNKDGEIVGTKTFSLKEESAGTLRFISFIQEIVILLESGGVFIIDEMSARLHPVLTRFILDLFLSKLNTKHAQLIFTTHDTSIQNKETLRRDEIAFVDKNEMGESQLYTLANLKVRSDATYNKDYFFGKYGAIPIIKSEFLNEVGD